jgi:TatD DNase family protein
MLPIIDSHIHLDLYEDKQLEHLLGSLAAAAGDNTAYSVAGLVAVSMHQPSCRRVLQLKRRCPGLIFPAFGFHPEQLLPEPAVVDRLLRWIREHREETAAIGEVGLPYYTRTTAELRGDSFNQEPYVLLLERFVRLAASLEKPIVLHAVYEDAFIACNLLEKHGVRKAHFHWFKGNSKILSHMMERGYSVSITPDVLYEAEIREIVKAYPIGLLMVETDGPWPFEGPFTGQTTHPRMILDTIRQIAEIKRLSVQDTAAILYDNTRRFYELPL